MNEKLDEIQRKIIELLLDGKGIRLNKSEISRLIGITPSTLEYKINKLERKGVLKGFVPVIGEDRGFWVFDINTPPHAQLPKELLKDPLVRTIYTGAEHTYMSYSAPKEQMHAFQSNLRREYGLEVYGINLIMDAIVKSAPYIQKKS